MNADDTFLGSSIGPFDRAEDNHVPNTPVKAPTRDPAGESVAIFDDAEELRLLSRSPHPYHHKNADLLHPADRIAPLSPTRTLRPRPRPNVPSQAVSSSSGLRASTTPSASTAMPSLIHSALAGFFGKDSTPASDSGTEADDEHFLKGLPAPRAKPHKGLRGMNEVLSGSSTPLLLPTGAGGRKVSEGQRRGRRHARGSEGGLDTGDDDGLSGRISSLEGSRVGHGSNGRNTDEDGGPHGTRNRTVSPLGLFHKLKRDAVVLDSILDSRDRDRRQGKDSAQRSRRRREIVRRSTELLLLVSLGALMFSNPNVRPLVYHWRLELQAVSIATVGLLLLYPVRLAIFTYRQQKQTLASCPASDGHDEHGHDDSRPTPRPLHQLIGVPVSFDPAPILYPLAVPIFVSFLLATPTLHAAPLLNFILSICALPKPLIPLAQTGEVYTPVQWALSCVPMIVAQRWPSPFKAQVRASLQDTLPLSELSPESVTLLYPLHQTLCWLLCDLTTTSLLPAELQLLSIALINLLVLAASPQAVILQALLWIGGLCILVFGTRVVRWGVTLARIPRWRFRREEGPTPSDWSLTGFVRRVWAEIQMIRRARLEIMHGVGDHHESDNSDNSDVNPSQSRRKRQKTGLGFPNANQSESESDAKPKRRAVKLKRPARHQGVSKESAQHGEGREQDGHEAAANTSNNDGTVEFQRFIADKTFASPSFPIEHDLAAANIPRSSTLPATPPRSSKRARQYTHTPSGRRKRATSPTVRAFFMLTHEQAAHRKWLYAGYLYACIGLAILVAARWYIGRFALHGHEPFGWALGYLFGDIDWFRLEVVKANLEYWVCLPPRTAGRFALFAASSSSLPAAATDCLYCGAGWVEHIRQAWLGAATTRLFLLAYWMVIIVFGLAVVFTLSPVYEVDTRRKVFHFMMVAMLLPATFVDPAYATLALSLVLAVFLLLDLLRASQLPPLSRPIANFLTPYVDGRDLRGPVVISHIFLLIGCAIPLWLSLGAVPRSGTTATTDEKSGCTAGWEVPTRDVSMVSGVICVGLGDAAASLIGRRWGRRKWLWGGGKSLEGSVAFATAVFAGLMAASLWLQVGGWPMTGEDGAGSKSGAPQGLDSVGTGSLPASSIVTAVLSAIPASLHRAWVWTAGRAAQAVAPRAAVCATMASLTEAVLTGGNDNVVVPVILWTCVKSFGL